MTLENFFTAATLELKKVHLEKGETYPLDVKNPLILFTKEQEMALSFDDEREKILKREEMIFFPQALSCLLSTSNSGEVYFFLIADPSLYFYRYISGSPVTNLLPEKELFHSLKTPFLIQKFIDSLFSYQKDGMLSQSLMEIKTAEFFTLLKLLYTKDVLTAFFAPILNSNHYFKMMVLSSYKNIKTVEEFSQLSGISPSTFNRLFHKTFGVSPYRWMIQKKSESLQRAILSSSKPLKQIAYESGFSSLSQMIDFCKKHTGKTPGEIRKIDAR